MNGTFSVAEAINDFGQAVGVFALNGSDFSLFHAALWANGSAQDLGLGVAEDINSTGQVVGVPLPRVTVEQSFGILTAKAKI